MHEAFKIGLHQGEIKEFYVRCILFIKTVCIKL